MSEPNGCDTLLLTCNAKAANLKTFPLSTSIVSWCEKQNKDGGGWKKNRGYDLRKRAHKQGAVCPTHLTWEQIFPSRTSVPPLPTEPPSAKGAEKKKNYVSNCPTSVFKCWSIKNASLLLRRKVGKTHKSAGKREWKSFSGLSVPPRHGRWYAPKAGSTVSVSHGDRSALPAKKKPDNPNCTATFDHALRSRAPRTAQVKQTNVYKKRLNLTLFPIPMSLNKLELLQNVTPKTAASSRFFPPPFRIERPHSHLNRTRFLWTR